MRIITIYCLVTLCGVSEPKPTCGVVMSSPAIRGQNVTLSCSMTYHSLTEAGGWSTGASLSASLNWDSAAGTFLNKSSTAVTNSRGHRIRETLQVDVMTLASGAEIPSYNCTSSFRFSGSDSNDYTFGLNNVTWTCVSPPVITWCMYFGHYFKLLL